MCFSTLNRSLLSRILAVITVSLLLPTSTVAENTVKLEDLHKMSLDELMQVKITGSTRTPEDLRTVPSAVTVFTQTEIKLLGINTLDELVNLVPGFQAFRSSGASVISPFSSRVTKLGTKSAEILVIVDGQRFRDPRTGGCSAIVSKIPLQLIERIEFIRGPGAAAYGSNAMMGVINIVTVSGVNELNVSYGSFNRQRASLQASRSKGELKVDLSCLFETDDGDDYRVQDTFSPNQINTDDPRELASLSAAISWNNTKLSLKHYQTSMENFYIQARLSNGFNLRNTKFSSLSLKQSFDWRSTKSFFWLGYTRTRTDLAGQLSGPGDLTAISNPSSDDALFARVEYVGFNEVRAQWHSDLDISNRGDLQLGIEIRHLTSPEVVAKNNFDMGDLATGNYPIRYYGTMLATTMIQEESSRDILGIYSQYQNLLFERTHFTIGLRFDDFSGIASNLSTRVGLVQELNNHHSIKLLYGEAFRAPTADELNIQNNPVLLGNPDLKPETVKSWDIIWMGQWSHSRVSLGYFENWFDNSIRKINVGNGTVQQYSNWHLDPTKGFEFEITHEINGNWLMRASFAQITEKPDIAFREANQMASLMANFQKGKWNANLVTVVNGERETLNRDDFNNRIILDDYWQVFGMLRYDITKNLLGYVQAKNLIDENYQTPAEPATLTEGIPNRGREMIAGLIWKF